VNHLRGFSCSQPCCWRFRSLGLWLHVFGLVVPDVSNCPFL